MASNDDPPNLGKPQFASHAWFEPTVSQTKEDDVDVHSRILRSLSASWLPL